MVAFIFLHSKSLLASLVLQYNTVNTKRFTKKRVFEGKHNALGIHQNFCLLSWESKEPLQCSAQIYSIDMKITKAFQVNNIGQLSCFKQAFLFYFIAVWSSSYVMSDKVSSKFQNNH